MKIFKYLVEANQALNRLKDQLNFEDHFSKFHNVYILVSKVIVRLQGFIGALKTH